LRYLYLAYTHFFQSCQNYDLRGFLERPVIHVQHLTRLFSQACQDSPIAENQPHFLALKEVLQGINLYR